MQGWQIDPDAMTLEEVELVCEATGTRTLAEFLARAREVCSDVMNAPVGDARRFVTALVWLARREEDPAFTMEQAARMPFSELFTVMAAIAARPQPPSPARARSTF